MNQNHTKQEEFLAVFEPLRSRLSRYIYALVRNREEARDVMSDTILLAYERFDGVRNRESFVFFLFTIARRLYHRSERRKKLFFVFSREETETFSVHDHLPDTTAEIRLLYDALAQLPNRQREAIALFDIAGLSLEEVRAVQGGTVSGVKTRLKRGRERLALLLGVRNDIHTQEQHQQLPYTTTTTPETAGN